MFALAPHQAMMIAINCIALVLGAPGNILVLRVYLSKPRKTSTHILIMGLALSDLISLCFTFPLEIVSWHQEYEMAGRQAFCRLAKFCYHYFAQCSVLITVAIAIDRYNAVCRPHQWKITTGRAQGVVATCFVLSTFTSLAAIFSFGVETIQESAASVYFESDNPTDLINVTLCHRDFEGGFNRAVHIFHTVWFFTLFLVLTVAYLRIYLSIRKRVTAGIAAPEPDPSRMRVVRPVIRFISHLTVVTKAGSADDGGNINNNTADGGSVDQEQATCSTDNPSPSIPMRPPEKDSLPWLQGERPAAPTGRSNNAVARALLLAGKTHRPVLPSVGGATPPQDTGQTRVEQPTAGDRDKPPEPSVPRPLPRVRSKTSWNKIRPKFIEEQEAKTPQTETPSGTEGRSADAVPTPITNFLHKRAAATAMNLKIQKTTTNMLLVAALTAVATWLPTTITEVSIPNVNRWLIGKPVGLQVFVCFVGWLFLFNFVTNPFVYSLMNNRFREDCGKSFSKCKLCCKKTSTVQMNEK